MVRRMLSMNDKRKEGFEEYQRLLKAIVDYQVWLLGHTPDTSTRDQAILKLTDARLWAAEALSKNIKE